MNATTRAISRDEAIRLLTAREGEVDFDLYTTSDLLHAAEADSGLPCADCGRLVTYDKEYGDWSHVAPLAAADCFLASMGGTR